MQWKRQEHLLTIIVALHCKHVVIASSGMTTTNLPQALFVQPGKTSRVTAITSGQHNFWCNQLRCSY